MKKTEKTTRPKKTDMEEKQGQSPTAPAWPAEPPPYLDSKNPFRMGQYPLLGTGPDVETVKGQMKGDFTFTLDKPPDSYAGYNKTETQNRRETDEASMGQEDERSTCSEQSQRYKDRLEYQSRTADKPEVAHLVDRLNYLEAVIKESNENEWRQRTQHGRQDDRPQETEDHDEATPPGQSPEARPKQKNKKDQTLPERSKQPGVSWEESINNMESEIHDLTERMRKHRDRTSTPRPKSELYLNRDPASAWLQPNNQGAMRLSLEGVITPQNGEGGEGHGHKSSLKRTQSWARDGGRLGRTTKLSFCPEEAEGQEQVAQQYPLVVKGFGQEPLYVPWSFMDMIGLAGRLPTLTDGANKWITALEESTAGVTLALGDIKALLMHTAGKQITEEVFQGAQLPRVVSGNQADGVGFGGHRTQLWAELRKHYPEKMDPSKLDGEKLKGDECPTKFLHAFQRRWRDETGGAWNTNNTTQRLFMLMVKKAMPQNVQKCLDGVVGLMKMDWPLFSEHIVHHVDNCRKEKQEADDLNTQLVNKLTQLQLGELYKQKKDKSKTQAPVITAPAQALENPMLQAPVMLQPPPRPQAPTGPGQAEQAKFPAATLPPIHVHVGPQNSHPAHWKGRGGPMQRGGKPRGGGGRGRGQPPPWDGQRQSNPHPSDVQQRWECWGCGETGHFSRNCPHNPYAAPAADWQ